MYANPEAVPPPSSVRKAEEYLQRRLRHEPVPYITGVAQFYGREFAVDPRVLIPRPETELLVERALSAVKNREVAPEQEVRRASGWDIRDMRIADIGTGSGILAITLALELPESEVHAVDASQDALDVAGANARRHGVDQRIRFHRGHLGSPLSGRFEIVVANLPYIRSGDLPSLQPELNYEPQSALDGGADGMKFVGPLIDDLPRLLAEPGLALLEIDPPIATAATRRAHVSFTRRRTSGMPEVRVEVVKDLAGLERVLQISAWRGQ